jgi:hypothetical protein
MDFKLPLVCTVNDALRALTELVQGLATGAVLPEHAEPLAATIAAFVKAIEVAQIEDRLAALEACDEAPKEEHRYDA